MGPRTSLISPDTLQFYGKKIRAKSKFAPAPDIEQDKRRDEESRGGSEGDEKAVNGDKASPGEEKKQE